MDKCINHTFSQLHEHLLNTCQTEFICRLDDNHIPETNYLENLLNSIKYDSNIGSVWGIVLHPEIKDLNFDKKEFEKIIKNWKDKFFLNTYLQLKNHPTNSPLLVPDLYSTFMSRKSIIQDVWWIATEYKKSWYREETDLTLRITNAWYKQYIIPTASTYHM